MEKVTPMEPGQDILQTARVESSEPWPPAPGVRLEASVPGAARAAATLVGAASMELMGTSAVFGSGAAARGAQRPGKLARGGS
mmetsp:Transcript_67336/g.217421  ORF Transcript_67336/g.217421 Transcript_67336/m.217421 type:complete len:83 (-) Transcript_67336:18-266(-)